MSQRVAALWFPDWPVQAYSLSQQDQPADILIARNHAVEVCSASARRAGVRRGMRVRHAQALIPGITVAESDPERDARYFEPIAAGLDEVAASVEVVRPGLIVVNAGPVARFHGSEDAAIPKLLDAASRRGIDSFAGVADELATALIAARVGAVVPPGGSRDFLAPLPLRVLGHEVALGCGGGVVDKLSDLGVRTLGELAALPIKAVATRFGALGARCHEIARAAADRRVAPAPETHDLAVAARFEDPIERVDATVFAARTLATALHEKLRAASLSCARLCVTAEFESGQELSRTWRTREVLTEADTAQRVRWQLDGWMGSGALTALYLDPVEVVAPDSVGPLWGKDTSSQAQNRVVSRVAATLGTDAIVQPRLGGGRGVAQRITFVPYGEDPGPPDTGTWPGRIPGPLPGRVIDPGHPASAATLVSATGKPVHVTAEALLSEEPAGLAWGKDRHLVTGWAGPWPVDATWWETEAQAPRVARLQVSAEDGAWLLVWLGGRWRVEGVYE